MITPALPHSGLPPPASLCWDAVWGENGEERPPEQAAWMRLHAANVFIFLSKDKIGMSWAGHDDFHWMRSHDFHGNDQLMKQHHSRDNKWIVSKQRKNSHLFVLTKENFKHNSEEDKMNVRNGTRSRGKRGGKAGNIILRSACAVRRQLEGVTKQVRQREREGERDREINEKTTHAEED